MEKALLVVTEYGKSSWTLEDLSSELRELARTARTDVVDEVGCKLKQINPASFVGKGKIAEIAALAEEKGVDAVIFNEDLSGTQQKNIESVLGAKTIDRTQLILDIFARRARSNEGKVQVELAQLQYLLPRLTGTGVMLSRLGGGIGTRGPGEMKLEVDRRRIKTRITKLKKDLDGIRNQRGLRRKHRERVSGGRIALVGYTNAGKSTLLNSLTSSRIYVDNMLFSTLDPTVRKLALPDGQKVLFIDTVGFLYKLPHHLIEAFRATLEEAIEADLVLHVLDSSHPKIREQNEAVYNVLRELGIEQKPIITALNKIDKINDSFTTERLLRDFPDSVAISALYKKNLGCLLNKIALKLSGLIFTIRLKIPLTDIKRLYTIYSQGKVIERRYDGKFVYIEARVPEGLRKKLTSTE